jgi:hypothetical protein
MIARFVLRYNRSRAGPIDAVGPTRERAAAARSPPRE